MTTQAIALPRIQSALPILSEDRYLSSYLREVRAFPLLTPEEESELAEFYYEEHSCPTNWLKPEMVYHDGDSDPHGLIEFVSRKDADALPPDQDFGPNDFDFAVIDLIQKHERGES